MIILSDLANYSQFSLFIKLFINLFNLVNLYEWLARFDF